jgi:hypothetical protein
MPRDSTYHKREFSIEGVVYTFERRSSFRTYVWEPSESTYPLLEIVNGALLYRDCRIGRIRYGNVSSSDYSEPPKTCLIALFRELGRSALELSVYEHESEDDTYTKFLLMSLIVRTLLHGGLTQDQKAAFNKVLGSTDLEFSI